MIFIKNGLNTNKYNKNDKRIYIREEEDGSVKTFTYAIEDKWCFKNT